MARKPWREISAKNHEDPARVARVEAGARAMLVLSELTRLRESCGLTQAELAASLGLSQARVSQIEHQADFTFSTLDQVIHGMGGELAISVMFPDKTVDLLGNARGEASEQPAHGSSMAFGSALPAVKPPIRTVHGPGRVYTVRAGAHLIQSKQADDSLIAASIGTRLAELKQRTPAHTRKAR